MHKNKREDWYNVPTDVDCVLKNLLQHNKGNNYWSCKPKTYELIVNKQK